MFIEMENYSFWEAERNPNGLQRIQLYKEILENNSHMGTMWVNSYKFSHLCNNDPIRKTSHVTKVHRKSKAFL